MLWSCSRERGPVSLRECRVCGEAKPVDAYYYAVAGRLRSECKPCTYVIRKKSEEVVRERNAKRVAKDRRWWLQNSYGLSVERYDELLNEFGGRCWICREFCPTGRRLSVDHDRACCSGHKSCGGCIRGLLCFACNTSLGKFKDDLGVLQNAIDY